MTRRGQSLPGVRFCSRLSLLASDLIWLPFLPVAPGCLFGAVASDVRAEFDDQTVVDHTVDRGCSGQWIFENLIPL